MVPAKFTSAYICRYLRFIKQDVGTCFQPFVLHSLLSEILHQSLLRPPSPTGAEQRLVRLLLLVLTLDLTCIEVLFSSDYLHLTSCYDQLLYFSDDFNQRRVGEQARLTRNANTSKLSPYSESGYNDCAVLDPLSPLACSWRRGLSSPEALLSCVTVSALTSSEQIFQDGLVPNVARFGIVRLRRRPACSATFVSGVHRLGL
jgi:hypothetical protein